MNYLLICLVLVGGYIYFRKKKQKKGKTYVEPKSKIGNVVKFSEEQLKQSSDDAPERKDSYERITKIENTYGSKLRDALNALLSELVLSKGNKTFSGKSSQSGSMLAETIATIDDQYVIPLIPKDSEDYVSWWHSALIIVRGIIMNNSEYPKQAQVLYDMFQDVEAVNNLLDNHGVLEKLNSGQACDIELFVCNTGGPSRTIEIKSRISNNGHLYHEIIGGYKYFKTDLSSDPLTQMIELLCASVHFIQMSSCSLWRCDMEKFNLPSVTKHTTSTPIAE